MPVPLSRTTSSNVLAAIAPNEAAGVLKLPLPKRRMAVAVNVVTGNQNKENMNVPVDGGNNKIYSQQSIWRSSEKKIVNPDVFAGSRHETEENVSALACNPRNTAESAVEFCRKSSKDVEPISGNMSTQQAGVERQPSIIFSRPRPPPLSIINRGGSDNTFNCFTIESSTPSLDVVVRTLPIPTSTTSAGTGSSGGSGLSTLLGTSLLLSCLSSPASSSGPERSSSSEIFARVSDRMQPYYKRSNADCAVKRSGDESLVQGEIRNDTGKKVSKDTGCRRDMCVSADHNISGPTGMATSGIDEIPESLALPPPLWQTPNSSSIIKKNQKDFVNENIRRSLIFEGNMDVPVIVLTKSGDAQDIMSPLPFTNGSSRKNRPKKELIARKGALNITRLEDIICISEASYVGEKKNWNKTSKRRSRGSRRQRADRYSNGSSGGILGRLSSIEKISDGDAPAYLDVKDEMPSQSAETSLISSSTESDQRKSSTIYSNEHDSGGHLSIYSISSDSSPGIISQDIHSDSDNTSEDISVYIPDRIPAVQLGDASSGEEEEEEDGSYGEEDDDDDYKSGESQFKSDDEDLIYDEDESSWKGKFQKKGATSEQSNTSQLTKNLTSHLPAEHSSAVIDDEFDALSQGSFNEDETETPDDCGSFGCLLVTPETGEDSATEIKITSIISGEKEAENVLGSRRNEGIVHHSISEKVLSPSEVQPLKSSGENDAPENESSKIEAFKEPEEKNVKMRRDRYLKNDSTRHNYTEEKHIQQQILGGSSKILKETNSLKGGQSIPRGERDSVRTAAPIKRGKWTLGSQIGAGSFGVVHVGMNALTGTLMAVKSLHVPILSRHGSALMDDMQREIDLMRLLHHRNIVRYIGAEMNRPRQVLHIFQEWVPGGSVSSLLRKFGPFPLPVCRSYLQQILVGLDYLHSNGILHRDIKGGNILVNDEGIVKLADFGASRKMPSPEEDNESVEKGGRHGQSHDLDSLESLTMRGTPYFMAPEVIEGKYGTKADIWSVGGVAVQMFTGKAPWSGMGFSSPMSLFLHLRTHDGPPPLHLESIGSGAVEINEDDASTISRKHLEGLVKMCFCRDSSSRPSAQNLLQNVFFEIDESSVSECMSPESDKASFNGSPGSSSHHPYLYKDVHQLSETRVSTIKDDFVGGSSPEASRSVSNPDGWPSWAKAQNRLSNGTPPLSAGKGRAYTELSRSKAYYDGSPSSSRRLQRDVLGHLKLKNPFGLQS